MENGSLLDGDSLLFMRCSDQASSLNNWTLILSQVLRSVKFHNLKIKKNIGGGNYYLEILFVLWLFSITWSLICLSIYHVYND